MPSRHRFLPTNVDRSVLEDRLVLNARTASPVLLQGLHAPVRVFRPGAKAPVSSLVDLAYQSFLQDYQAVRGTFYASLQDRTATDADRTAFTNYTRQRVNLLAQQVTNSLLLYNQSTSRGSRQDDPLPLIVLRINGATDRRGVTPRQQTTPASSLVQSLTDSTPALNASPTTIALSTVSQDNAIEASRVATLNGVTIVRNGDFGGRKKS
jgi:hypothetical protein